MILLKKILVATDFSEPSDTALAYGRELARAFNASLTVLHASTTLPRGATARRATSTSTLSRAVC